jgi:cytidine deaminase
MPKESVDIVISALIASFIAVAAQATGANKDVIAYALIFFFSYLLVPRLIAYWSNWSELGGPSYFIEFHERDGYPVIAFGAMWPNFWKKTISAKGTAFRLTKEHNAFHLMQHGTWKSDQVQFKQRFMSGRELFYFYSAHMQNGRHGGTVPEGLTSISLDDEGNGQGFYVDRLETTDIIRRRTLSFYRITSVECERLRSEPYSMKFNLLGGVSTEEISAFRRVLIQTCNEQIRPGSLFEPITSEAFKRHLAMCKELNPTNVLHEAEVKSILGWLKARTKNCDARFSNFLVSSCVITRDDRKFFGVNFENSSFSAGLCAESSAIANMVSEIGPSIIDRIYVYSPNNAASFSPCGICLQRISDYSDTETRVIVLSDSQVLFNHKIGELLRAQFRLEPS